jgi:hypothetical protein
MLHFLIRHSARVGIGFARAVTEIGYTTGLPDLAATLDFAGAERDDGSRC